MNYIRSYPHIPHFHAYKCPSYRLCRNANLNKKVEAWKFIKELSVLTGVILVILSVAVVLQG